MKKIISIINYILVIILATVGSFKMYVLNSNVDVKNILGDTIGFEYAFAILLIIPLVLYILMSVFKAYTMEFIAVDKEKYKKKYLNGNKINMDVRWKPVISIVLLLLSILPMLFSIITNHALIKASTIIAILIYLILIFNSYLWSYYNNLDLFIDKKEAWKSTKTAIKGLVLLIFIGSMISVSTIVIMKLDEFRDKKLMEYVLSDIQNPKEASDGYLSIEDIKDKIMKDYYPEDVYYSMVAHNEEDKVSFITYVDSSDIVSIYQYELTDNGYKYKLKIANSSISKDDIKEYDGIFDN